MDLKCSSVLDRADFKLCMWKLLNIWPMWNDRLFCTVSILVIRWNLFLMQWHWICKKKEEKKRKTIRIFLMLCKKATNLGGGFTKITIWGIRSFQCDALSFLIHTIFSVYYILISTCSCRYTSFIESQLLLSPLKNTLMFPCVQIPDGIRSFVESGIGAEQIHQRMQFIRGSDWMWETSAFPVLITTLMQGPFKIEFYSGLVLETRVLW